MMQLNSAGYELQEISFDHWLFRINGRTSISGTFQQIVILMVLSNGFHLDDIEDAVREMVNKDCDAIHFGMYKTMIYPYKQKDKKVA